MKSNERIPGSFRDPSGFLFRHHGAIYRQVNLSYRDDYTQLMECGLYAALVDEGLLIPHSEVDIAAPEPDKTFKVIQPEPLPFVSYPYEWCFSQLKDAALTTLEVQQRAVDFGMSLKDSSAYNVQFVRGRPVFIDSLSFERHREGKPWPAYRQFCQHFLAPLALMSRRDVRLNLLLRAYLDGIPLDLAGSLLPFGTRFSFPLLAHIHLHAKSQRYFADKTVDPRQRKMSMLSFRGLFDSLKSCVEGLEWRPEGTEWADYYDTSSYPPDALEHKRRLVSDFVKEVKPETVWDLGANIGTFSRVASDQGIHTVSLDADHGAVERNYKKCREDREANILPLLLDLTNPSPAIGWANEERRSLLDRGPTEMVFALALVHHLAISNNLPLNRISDFMTRICSWLVIEFVPKSDPQVKRLLSTREDIFPGYTRRAFETAFERYFTIHRSSELPGTLRTVYLMEETRDQ